MIRRYWEKGWPPLTAAILFLVGWQLYVSLNDVEKWFLPGPLDVWTEAVQNWGQLSIHVISSLQLTLLGFAIGILVAFVLAILLHFSPILQRGIFPLLVLSQTIPLVLLGPLLLFWLGYGWSTRLFVVALVCFFPILIAFLNGLKQTDPTMLNYMRMIGASRWQRFIKLELPAAVSPLFAGIKIAATYCVTGAVIAEWFGAENGLGKYIMFSKAGFRMDRALLGVLLVVLLSLLIVGVVALVERYFLRWQSVTKGVDQR
jgi:ABC-type nitrate/sulfonate/bicarbonate transport system permease component